MTFQAKANQELVIDDVLYRIAEHPAAPGVPYGQEGRQAIVYQLAAEGGGKRALKVFKPRYRLPALVALADKLAPFAELPGLQVCQRTVLSARRHGDLLRQYPDLTYAVLMPWIEGPTWMETVLERRELPPEQSWALARSLATILAGMEEQGLAHCDLSGPNVLLPMLVGGKGLELVDVEQLHAPGLERPDLLPSGSPGYAHKTAPAGLWGLNADRFAGAVMLAEMLGWCDERVREAAWGEQYFDKKEVQEKGKRYRLLVKVLRERWGERVAALFERAWQSETLQDCPTFGEWLVTLPQEVPTSSVRGETKHAPTAADDATLRSLMGLARRFEKQGQVAAALETYRQAQTAVPAESSAVEELALIVQDLEKQLQDQKQLSLEGTDLTRLFDDGLVAYENGRWAKANELLREVERIQPGYRRGGREVKGLLAEVEKQLATSWPKSFLWAWVSGTLVVLALVAGLVAKQKFGVRPSEATIILSPTNNTSTFTPIPTHTSTLTPRPTRSPTIAPVPTADTPRPSATPTGTPTLTPVPTRVTATAPTLVLPEQGQTYQSPVTFQWQGTLGTGQTYWVRVWHADSGFSLESPSLSTTSWTSALPGDKFGEWLWNVSVLQNGSVVAISQEGMFWFNPFPGGGDDHTSPQPTPPRPDRRGDESPKDINAVTQ